MEISFKYNCKNCKYYVKHYAKVSTKLVNVNGCGHCINININKKEFKKCLSKNEPCNFWEPIDTQIDKEKIKDILKRIADRLDDLVLLLDKN